MDLGVEAKKKKFQLDLLILGEPHDTITSIYNEGRDKLLHSIYAPFGSRIKK
jgi:hypothetical protein